MSAEKKCERCKQVFNEGLPAPGMSKLWGTVTMNTHEIRFNRVLMNTWEDAKDASMVIRSSTYTPVMLCGKCWGDVLGFIVETSTK